MNLYPRLPLSVARQLAGERARLSPVELVALSETFHRAAIYAPTGGNRVREDHLKYIQFQIRQAASSLGYPANSDESTRRRFDGLSASILHNTMGISASEASQQGVWAFMSTILLPDIVRWRFPGSLETGTTPERFLGGTRGIRNTLGRVWWRAFILQQPGLPDPYQFISELGEDELVQIMERPNLAGNAALARQICRSLLEASYYQQNIPRSELLRDAMKRLRRLLPLVSFEAIDSAELVTLVNQIFGQSVASMKVIDLHVNI